VTPQAGSEAPAPQARDVDEVSLRHERREAPGGRRLARPRAAGRLRSVGCALRRVGVGAFQPRFLDGREKAPDKTCLAPAERGFCSGPADPAANSRQFGPRDILPSVAARSAAASQYSYRRYQ